MLFVCLDPFLVQLCCVMWSQEPKFWLRMTACDLHGSKCVQSAGQADSCTMFTEAGVYTVLCGVDITAVSYTHLDVYKRQG